MRILLPLATTALLLAGCDRSPAEPASIPVRLTSVPGLPALPPPPPSIVGDGDSVVVEAVLSVSGCYDRSAGASRAGDVLVVTFTTRENGMLCLQYVAVERFRAVAAPVPAGAYAVVVRDRTLDRSGRQMGSRELGRASVVLP